MSNRNFAIEIIEQHWLESTEQEGISYDLCSHGSIRLMIGNQPIAPEDNDYGISESALAMLRSVYADHTPEKPLAERMVFHGCGAMLMMGCPIGLDWSVRHEGDTVRIGDVVRYDTTYESKAVRFPELSVLLSTSEYKRQVAQFATGAKEFFAGSTKKFDEDWEKQKYDAFWVEFDQLLNA